MKVIGLTGGIASGKSTVSDILKRQGAVIIDADQVAREIVEPGMPALLKIEEAFGSGVINEDGTMNRKMVRELVFSEEGAEHLKRLNGIMHPAIIDEILNRINLLKEKNECDVIFLDCPLLFELGMDTFTDENWLVYTDIEIQIQRLMVRDQSSREQAAKIIENQMPIEEKKKRAQVLIDNSHLLETLEAKVVGLYKGIML